MNSNNAPGDPSDADITLDLAIRRRREQGLAGRTEPADPASGTSRVAARLAEARAAALTRPRRPDGLIDLT